jgi:peptidoglycan/xylan/chitin deacetylase (PgdA/CDA1 family)
MRASGTLIILLCLSLLMPLQAGADVGPAAATGLTAVEQTLLRALESAGVAEHVVRVAADTNGYLTVASISFTYAAGDAQFLPPLNATAWRILRAAFAGVPILNEIDLLAFHQKSGWFNGLRRDPTMTAAVTPAEMARVPAGTPDDLALAWLPRVWFHPALIRAGMASADLEHHARHLLSIGVLLEDTPAFEGSPRERAIELSHSRLGRTKGGIVEGKLYRGDPTRPVLALTFDDGPSPIYTTLLLDSLRRTGVRATFFLVGLRVLQYPYFAREIMAAGHELANHSFHHVNLTRLSRSQVSDELALTQSVILGVTGMTPHYFRPPGGRYNPAVLAAAQALGLITVFWTDDPGDYGYPVPQVEQKLFALVANGGIVVLHQGVGTTIRELPKIIGTLRRRGFTFTTVSGLVAPRQGPATRDSSRAALVTGRKR